uniref:Uncharacterized protein n=1 Tax=Meloidogyne hapla TaxID=6305 RepID=A0A1I8BUS9_MELHA
MAAKLEDNFRKFLSKTPQLAKKLRCLLPSIPGINCAIGIRHYEHAAINKHVVGVFGGGLDIWR